MLQCSAYIYGNHGKPKQSIQIACVILDICIVSEQNSKIYKRVFLVTSTLESSTAPSFVSCILVPSCNLFSLRIERMKQDVKLDTGGLVSLASSEYLDYKENCKDYKTPKTTLSGIG